MLSSATPGSEVSFSVDGSAPAAVATGPFTIATPGRAVIRAVAMTRNASTGVVNASSEERAWTVFLQGETAAPAEAPGRKSDAVPHQAPPPTHPFPAPQKP